MATADPPPASQLARHRAWALYACLGALLYAPLALHGMLGGFGQRPWAHVGAALALEALLLLAPLLLIRSVKRVLWLFAPLAALSALYIAFVAAFSYAPHAGTYYLFIAHTNPEGLHEFIGVEWRFVVLASVTWAAYLACLWSSRVPDASPPAAARPAAQGLLATYVGLAALTLVVHGAEDLPSWRDLYPGFVGAEFGVAWEASQEAHHRQVLHEKLATYRFGVTAAPAPARRELQVLIIGESSRYDHWGVNGYARQTSPRLAAYGPGELISFSDVSAPANFTLRALNLALTSLQARSYGAKKRERSVVSLFREAGYHTTWLSNQDDSIKEALEADRTVVLNPEWLTNKAQDTALLPLLDRALSDVTGNQLIVLHIMGNHTGYSRRYTAEQARFGPKTPDLAQLFGPMSRTTVTDHYDNSILAVDAFIDAVVQRARATGRNALVTYVSDHGECLLDDERLYRVHATPTSSRVEVHVPLFLMPSPAYRAAYPERVHALEANRARPAAQDDLIWWLADLAGIRHAQATPEQCIGSPAYRPPTVRYTVLPNGVPVEITTLR